MPSAIEQDSEYYPAEFPSDVETVELARISVQKLLDGDEEEAKTLFNVCSNEGFFQLDLTTDPRGLEFLAESKKLHNVAREVFNSVPIEEKLKFPPTDATGHLETGYKNVSVDKDGQPNKAEFLNISHFGLLNKPDEYKLPDWLAGREDLYRSFMSNGNAIANIIFTILERQLHLKPGELTDMHQTKDASGDFLRMFRYPAPKDGKPSANPPTPAHTDATSMTILFNWQGGLQITRPKEAGKVDMEDVDKAEDDWLYVKPEPGCAIVNLGDTMVILTNGVLKSGRHRVVTPPGPQGRFHRYSVLTNARPANDTLMRALKSDVIPPPNAEQDREEVLTALQWGMKKVRAILNRMEKPPAAVK